MSVKDLKKLFLTLPLFLSGIFLLQAQQGTVSPYSRYGVGELVPNIFVWQTGMGGSGNAVYAQDRLNFVNPASYAYDTITTFDAGVQGELSQLKTSYTSQSANTASLSYIAFGFPVIKNKWGAGFGVMPYSNVGYNVVTQEVNEQSGRVNYTFEGDGGLSRIYLANAYAPFGKLSTKFSASEKYKKLVADKDTIKIKRINRRNNFLKGFSIGVNASWLFGPINETRKIEFVDASSTYNTKVFNSTSMGDGYFNFGLLYSYIMKNEKFFNIGLTGAMSTDISTKTNTLWYNYTSVGGAFEEIADTVQFIADQKGTTTIPVYYSAGIATGKKGNWLAAIDFTMQDWTEFQSAGTDQSLNNGYKIALGGEYVPDKKGFSYTQKIQYRFGGHYTKSYLTLNNTDIKDYGLSLGFGLPIINKDRIQKATVQIGIEGGIKGTTENNLIEQQYLRFHFGITLNESWFYKKQYY